MSARIAMISNRRSNESGVSLIKIIILSGLITTLSGCVIGSTGNKNIDGAIYGTAGLLESKSTRQKQSQQEFERDLAKKSNAPRE